MLTIKESRKRLAIIWLSGSGILFFLLIAQTIFKHYGERAGDAWSWFLPTIMPTLSLILGVLVLDSLDRSQVAGRADGFLYRLAAILSGLYLVTVGLTFS